MEMCATATGKSPGSKMKTIDKAMYLLDYFVPETPEWRLSDLARAAGMDKVTAMRILNSLASGGLIEQHPETRKYRLGTAVLRLARIREACFPVVAVLQPILEKLTQETGETCHACLFSGASMTTIAIAEPPRATRVFVDASQPLPVYASASGMAFLAHVDARIAEETLSRLSIRQFAANTPPDRTAIEAALERARRDGYAISARTFEEDVTGIGAPIFDWHGQVQASLAAACLTSRMTEDSEKRIARAVLTAAKDATRAMGGDPTKNAL